MTCSLVVIARTCYYTLEGCHGTKYTVALISFQGKNKKDCDVRQGNNIEGAEFPAAHRVINSQKWRSWISYKRGII